jgi:hypothetical protein
MHLFMDLLILYIQQVGEIDILLNLVGSPPNACQSWPLEYNGILWSMDKTNGSIYRYELIPLLESNEKTYSSDLISLI